MSILNLLMDNDTLDRMINMQVVSELQLQQAHRAGWEQGKQQASGICKADIQEHAITISAAQQETHNNCCNYLAKAIDAMEYNHGN